MLHNQYLQQLSGLITVGKIKDIHMLYLPDGSTNVDI